MTNIDFNDIISTLIFSNCKEGSIKISMEVNAGNIKAKSLPHCKHHFVCKTSSKMTCDKKNNKTTDLHTSIKEITNYLIQFFYKTEKKYSCTQTKLGKLISIIAFKYAQQGVLLFDENIYEYPKHCGTLIKALTFIPQNIYTRSLYEQDCDKSTENTDDFIDAEIPVQYVCVCDLSDSIKKEIESVFRNFGSYSGDELAKNLNPIVDKIIKNDSDELDLSLLQSLEKNDYTIDQSNNKIVNYIYK